MTDVPKRFESPPGLIWRDTTGLAKEFNVENPGISHQWRAEVGEAYILLSKFDYREKYYFVVFSASLHASSMPSVTADNPHDAALQAFEACALIVSNLDDDFQRLRPKDERVPARIRITSNTANGRWYAGKFGQEFPVVRITASGDYGTRDQSYVVKKEDAEIVEWAQPGTVSKEGRINEP